MYANSFSIKLEGKRPIATRFITARTGNNPNASQQQKWVSCDVFTQLNPYDNENKMTTNLDNFQKIYS